jgi:hypothetical protein
VCRYKKDLFEPNARQHWIADYKTIFAKAVANPETSLGRLTESLKGRGRMSTRRPKKNVPRDSMQVPA